MEKTAKTFVFQQKYWPFWLLLFGLILRLFHLGAWSFWHDEAITVLLAQKPIPDLIAITAADVHPPLYYLLVKPFLWLGQSETLARLPSALWGAGSVLALYLLGRDLFEPRVGLAGGLIIALSPLQLFYAQEARMYTQLVSLTILSSWLLFRALRADGWLWWALFGLGVTLASYTAYFAFPVWAAMAAYLLFVDRRRPQIIKFGLTMAGVALLYAPWLSVFLSQTRAVSDTYWIAPPNPLILFPTMSAFFTSYTLPSLGVAIALAATLLILLISLNDARYAFKDRRDVQSLLWLILWGLIPLLLTFLVSFIVPIFQLRTVMTAAPAFYLLVAWAISRPPRWRINLLIFLPLLGMIVLSLFNFYFNPVFAKPAWREAAQYVDQHTQPGDIVFHTSPGSYLPFLAYPHQVEHILLPDPAVAAENAPSQAIVTAVGGPAPTSITPLLQQHQRAWLVVGLDQSLEHQAAQKEWFDVQYQQVSEENMAGIHIFAFNLE